MEGQDCGGDWDWFLSDSDSPADTEGSKAYDRLHAIGDLDFSSDLSGDVGEEEG